MKKTISILFLSLFTFIVACKKETKLYEGPAQVAFASTTYSFKITKDTTVVIPVQLISSAVQPSFSVGIAADSTALGTVVASNAFPATATFDANRFVANVSVNASFAGFGASSSKALKLTLSSDSKKVAPNYRTTVITFSK